MRNYFLIYLIIGIFLISGCTSGLSAEEIQTKLIEANTNLKSYTGTFTQNIEITREIDGETTVTRSTSNSELFFDRLNKKMKTVTTIILDQGGSESEILMEMYIIDNYSYTKIGENWVKNKLSSDAYLFFWENQDQIEQLLTFIKGGAIEYLRDDSFGGSSYYVMRVEPDIEEVLRRALQGVAQLARDQTEDLIKEYSLTVWVNKDSFIIEKMNTDYHVVIPSSTIGGLQQGIEMRARMELELSNINQEVIIELSEEALNATLIV